MQADLSVSRFLLAITLSFLSLESPIKGDALKEAVPISNGHSSTQPAKPEGAETVKASEKKGEEAASSWGEDASYGSEPNDPLEPLNRVIFGVNDLVDFVILRPFAEIYRAILPDPVRNGVSNFLDNIFAPVSFLNHLLQFEGERATSTLFRFLMNSSFGIFGLVDVASDLDFPRYDTDFNQTLTAWGVDTGPYLVLPLVGPSSFRGGVGLVGDYYADPLNLYLNNRHHRKHRYWLTVRYGFDILNNREKVIETIDNLRNGSLDFYVTMRSIYFQRQAYMAQKLKAPNASESAKEGEK